MKKILLNILGWTTIVVIIVMTCVALFWKFYPYEPIVYNALPYQTDKDVYTQGDTAFYDVDYCKNTKIMPSVDRTFVDGLVFEAPTFPAFLQEGCHISRVPFQIPNSLPAGSYHLHVKITYQMNPIRTIVIENESNEFKVLDPINPKRNELIK